MHRAIIISLLSSGATLACVDEGASESWFTYADGDDATDAADGEPKPDPSEAGADPTNPEPQPDPDSDSGSDSGSGSDGAVGGDDGSTLKFDIHTPPTEIETTPCGVDILFIIDNSGSMSQHKANIIAAFDSFIGEMVDVLEPDTPIHVGVTRATGFYDPGNGSGWADNTCEFNYLDGTWNPPTQANNGIEGQQGRLYEENGKRYFEFIIGDDPAPLAAWFQETLVGAIANDEASNTESVIAAAAYPFHPINADYNAGFLREKAVLVLFLLSDAPDASPAEIPTAELIELVSDAKAGCGDGCVLPTGIVQGYCYDHPGNSNTRLYDFMNGFGAPPVALDFFIGNQAPGSFVSVLGATLAESIAYTCDMIAK